MSPDKLKISPTDTNGRFHRFGLIGWWNQDKLRHARALVIGAGALGNEILKNLALLGVGNILVADLDTVENSNLSRSVLYRAKDNGSPKAVAAARAAKDIYPDLNIHPFHGNIVYDLGLGVYRWADVVLGGLDNREARLSINRACWRTGRPWVDGAIEAIDGTARVFIPESHPLGKKDGPCYECTMSATDWRLLQMRRSCNLLSRSEMEAGKTPTTPTISSIIAGVQCQEAVKILHGMETIPGRGWVYSGLAADAYQTEFQRKPDCTSHETLTQIIALDGGVNSLTPRAVLAKARSILGAGAYLELGRDVLEKLVCPECHREQEMFASLGKVKADVATCPHCQANGGKTIRREVVTFHTIRGNESFLDRPLAAIGVPAFDIITARTGAGGDGAGARTIGLELSADAESVLGPLAVSESAEELEWS